MRKLIALVLTLILAMTAVSALAEGKLFMDWLISEENQAHMASVQDSVLRGVRTDLFVANEYMPAFDTLNLKQEDSEYTSGNKQTILDHWNDLWNK